jgi:hypothetical protein
MSSPVMSKSRRANNTKRLNEIVIRELDGDIKKNHKPKVYFKKVPVDPIIDIPLLANFYTFIANAAIKKTVLLHDLYMDIDIPECTRNYNTRLGCCD